MPDVPIEIANEEAIVRGICSPYHVSSKGKLKPEAYDPSPATDEVSVIRHAYVGSDFCKKKAKELEDREKRKIYQGLAVLSARQIRSVGSEVVDSRQIFFGHADIKHGFDLIEGEPLLYFPRKNGHVILGFLYCVG